MDRPQIVRTAPKKRLAGALILATAFLPLSLACRAQQPMNRTQPPSNPAQSTTIKAQPPVNAAPPLANAAAPVQSPVSGMLQPALDTVHRTLAALRVDKWKKGTVRDEASGNIDAIQNDLRTNLPPLLQTADAAPGAVSKLLPLSRHVDALYDVLLRVVEASRVVAPDDQAAQLQQALLSLGDARFAFNDRMQGSADAIEKQVIDLHATIQRQAAQRPIAPTPVALPCIPPPPHKTTTRARKPAPKPAQNPPAKTASGTSTAPAKTSSASTPPSSTH